MDIKRVSVIGLGYVGLPTAAIIASRGIDVIGVDVNDEAIDIINNGYAHILEPDLDTIVKSVVQLGKLKAVNEIEPSDVFIIAVPTPLTSNKEPDLTFIKSCVKPLASVLKSGNLIILESTSPVGTTENLSQWLASERKDLVFPHQDQSADIAIAHCPERILPGKILRELTDNDRIIGGLSMKCADKAKQLYEIFVTGEIYQTTARTAEMAKLAENAYRDVNIGYANELSMLCDKWNINTKELISLTNKHPRVNILSPGPGVGGHCIAVDPWFLIYGQDNPISLIKTARQVNSNKVNYIVDKIIEVINIHKPESVSCFGLAYKADIDDMRESPAVEIIIKLAETTDIDILVVDPYINELPHLCKDKESIKLVTVEEALTSSRILALLVDHMQFKKISKSKLNDKVLIDTKGIWI